MLRRVKKLLLVLLVLAVGVGMPVWASTGWGEALGGDLEGPRLERAMAYERYDDGAFTNTSPTALSAPGTALESAREFLFGEQQREPDGEVPVRRLSPEALAPDGRLKAAWFGHATTWITLGDAVVMTDPIFSDRPSPSPWIGPRRTHPAPAPLEALPPVDLVVISHDHYDHLDMNTVKALAAGGTVFAVPLGIGAHLERWGVPPDQVRELLWWERTTVGPLTVISTPNRHYSGRSVDLNETHWSSWVVHDDDHRVFYSGDTGADPVFSEVGRRLGPFDLAVVKIGAYDERWPEIHVTPEEALDIQAQVDGALLFPVHWLTYNLAYHAWDEPIRRLMTGAAARGAAVAAPEPGRWVVAGEDPPVEPWWEGVR